MKKELTDEMISSLFMKQSNFSIVQGIILIIVAILLVVLSRKKPDICNGIIKKIAKFSWVFIILAVLSVVSGISSRQSVDGFYVAECKITDMYRTGKQSGDSSRYYIECDDTYKIEINYNKYYREYSVGDTVYVIIKDKDSVSSVRHYHGDKYEYVGNCLLEQ